MTLGEEASEQIFRPTAHLKIAITSACTNSCPICFRSTCRGGVPKSPDLPVDLVRRTMSEAAELGFVGAYFTGGEPLLRYGELVSFIRHATSLGLCPTVVSSGGPLGAHGRYEELNAEAFRGAGTYGVPAEALACELREAGLERVMLSVDDSHNTLSGREATRADRVPTAVASAALGALLDEGFGDTHHLEAIGPRLRVTATASGPSARRSSSLLADVMQRAGLSPSGCSDEEPGGLRRYGGPRGMVALRLLETSAVGEAADLPAELVEDRTGSELFAIRCSNFKRRREAYDGGRHHGDLSVGPDGEVCLCGNGMFPVGNVVESSLAEIIRAVNEGDPEGPYGPCRAVLHRLLRLSQRAGDRAVGIALSMVAAEDPAILAGVSTEGGACTVLGRDPAAQTAFIEAFDRSTS